MNNNLEYRLYYNASGKVITYSTEKLNYDFIVITKEQYSEARSDVLVKDKKIIRTDNQINTYVLQKSTEGISCSKYDVNIIDVSNNSQRWKLVTHEII